MTREELANLFKEENGNFSFEYAKEIKDIDGFILLRELGLVEGDIIASADYDGVFLSIDIDKLCNVATKEIVKMLAHCHINYYEGEDTLHMFF